MRFEPLREEHFAMMHRWLNAPHVREFYIRRSTSPQEVRDMYLPRLDPIVAAEKEIGYIQVYRNLDYPDWENRPASAVIVAP